MAGKFDIDSVTLIYSDIDKKRVIFEEKDINDKLFIKIKDLLKDNAIKRIELENSECDISMIAFCEDGISSISLFDTFEDINYYYKNDKKSNKVISIAGEEVEENLICNDNNLLIEILKHFALKCETLKKVKWIEE